MCPRLDYIILASAASASHILGGQLVFSLCFFQVSLICRQCPCFPFKIPSDVSLGASQLGFYHIFLDLDNPCQSFFKGRFYDYQCFVRVYICAPHTHLMPEELRRGHQFSWNWNYTRCEPSCRCWAPDPRPLQEQQMLVIAELNLKTLGSPLEVQYFY